MDNMYEIIGELYVTLNKTQKYASQQNEIIKSKDEEISKLKEMLVVANKKIGELAKDAFKGASDK